MTASSGLGGGVRAGMRVAWIGMVTAVLAGGLVGLGGGVAGAQAATQSATSREPAVVTFTVRAPSAIRSAKLDYAVRSPTRDNSENFVGGAGDGQVAGQDASFTLQTITPQRYIPVGSQFRYRWTVVLENGSTVTTPDADYLHLDGRYEWKSQTDGLVTVYWYGSNDASAQSALRAARVSLDETSKLLEVQVRYPVRLMVYRNEDEGRAAKQSRSAAFDAQVMTGGQRVAPDLLLVFANNEDVVRHEVAHIVTHVAGDGPFVGVPSWLDEGQAVYSQRDPGAEYRGGLQLAIAADQVLPLTSINSPVSQPSQVNAFYGQSWSTVKFLIDTYGQPKYAELYRTIHAGSRIDDALQKVYGFDQDGLYNQWRQKNGLRPVAVTPRSTAAAAAAATGTVAPLGVPSGGGTFTGEVPTASGGGEGASGSGQGAEGPSSTVAFAVLGGAAVVALGLGGGAFVLMRKR